MTFLSIRYSLLDHSGYLPAFAAITNGKTHENKVYDLYHCRLPVEDDYKAVKSRMELEDFLGQSALSVYQDFYAKVFYKNIVSIPATPARRALENDVGTRMYT